MITEEALAEKKILTAADVIALPVPTAARMARLADFPVGIAGRIYETLDASRGLFIHGKTGRGKTYLAAAVMRALATREARTYINGCFATRADFGWHGDITTEEAERYVRFSLAAAKRFLMTAVFETSIQMLNAVRCSFEDHSTTAVVGRYAKAPLLVVDDIGMDRSNEFVREAFDNIINDRWSERRLTIFTSNLTFDELDQHYADHGRMTSRIAGMCDVVELVGVDRRTT